MKYMLIVCYERDIEVPRIYDTMENAHNAMLKDVADYIGFSYADIKREFSEGVRNFDGSTHIGEDYAYSDRHANCDWRIYKLEI